MKTLPFAAPSCSRRLDDRAELGGKFPKEDLQGKIKGGRVPLSDVAASSQLPRRNPFSIIDVRCQLTFRTCQLRLRIAHSIRSFSLVTFESTFVTLLSRAHEVISRNYVENRGKDRRTGETEFDFSKLLTRSPLQRKSRRTTKIYR